jgi:hypothetical protein
MAAPRVFTDDTDEDRAAITGIVNQISAYPLDELDGIAKITDWDDVPSLPEPEVEGETAWAVADEFFGRIPDVMDAVKPMPGEEALYASIRQVLDTAEHDPEVKKALVDVAVETTLAAAG